MKKLAKPPVLERNEEDWTKEYLDAVSAGEGKSKERWRHREIKQTLSKEVVGKCAYCEGVVEDVSYPHVEHILPKASRPDLAHSWENLTSACARCNVAKDVNVGLLNPYKDDVDGHLVFHGPLLHWEMGSVEGELTVRTLDLNRYELVVARMKRLDAIRDLLERWYGADEPLKETLARAVRLDAEEGEFSRSVMRYLEASRFPITG